MPKPKPPGTDSWPELDEEIDLASEEASGVVGQYDDMTQLAVWIVQIDKSSGEITGASYGFGTADLASKPGKWILPIRQFGDKALDVGPANGFAVALKRNGDVEGWYADRTELTLRNGGRATAAADTQVGTASA